MAINKVIYGGRTLIDLSGDTVTADKILDGFTAHDKKGETITGTCKYDVDSSDATAAVAEILQGKTAYVRGKKLTGTPKTTEQTVLPDTEEGYNYLSQVTVAAIPYQESENPAGGTTVTIG